MTYSYSIRKTIRKMKYYFSRRVVRRKCQELNIYLKGQKMIKSLTHNFGKNQSVARRIIEEYN